jgi:hypothetical protein
MPAKNNPFKPTQPVFRGMFTGRGHEIERIDRVLEETSNGNPTNLLLIGERGIGKTSLLLYTKMMAKGEIEISSKQFNFVPILIVLDKRTEIREFSRKISALLEREMRSAGILQQRMKDIWAFVQRFEIAGTKYVPTTPISDAEIFDRLVFSILDSLKLLQEEPSRADGILFLIDEADNTPKELDLGSLLKSLSERLVMEEKNNVLFVLAGLPDTKKVLFDSHRSSIRLFEECELLPLSPSEVKEVIRLGLHQANSKNTKPVTLREAALEKIVQYSEGYPHFVQQFGYSSYETDTDDNIDEKDVDTAAFKPGGAFDIIGDKYYKEMYFGIRQDAYRQVLKIMSTQWNQWITKKQIREKFSGKESTLTNALQALLEKKIILKRPDRNAEYRLQWAGFAFWISAFAVRYENRIKKFNGFHSTSKSD